MALKEGDFILINYTIKVVDNGEEKIIDTTIEEVARKNGIFDPSRTYGEYPVIVGKTGLLEAVREALTDMDVGEKKIIEAPPEKAFGEYRQDLVVRVPLKRLQRAGIRPIVGQEIDVGGRQGRIVRVTERFAFIDFNHPLAGKRVKIELEVSRKVEDEAEKAKLLAARIFRGLKDQVKASVEDRTIRITLPAEALGYRDLDAMLAQLARDIGDYLSPRRLFIEIEISYPEQTKGEEETRRESHEHSKEAEE